MAVECSSGTVSITASLRFFEWSYYIVCQAAQCSYSCADTGVDDGNSAYSLDPNSLRQVQVL